MPYGVVVACRLTRKQRLWSERDMDAMTPRSELFKLLKRRLSERGYWKNKARGNPARGLVRG
jgi:hypothetical protein